MRAAVRFLISQVRGAVEGGDTVTDAQDVGLIHSRYGPAPRESRRLDRNDRALPTMAPLSYRMSLLSLKMAFRQNVSVSSVQT